MSYGSPRLPRSHRRRSIYQGRTPVVAWLLSSGTYWCWKIFSRLIFEAFMPQWLKTEAASLLHTLRLLWPQIFRNDSLYKGPLLRLYHISFEAMLVPEKGLSKSALPLLTYLRFDGSTSLTIFDWHCPEATAAFWKFPFGNVTFQNEIFWMPHFYLSELQKLV